MDAAGYLSIVDRCHLPHGNVVMPFVMDAVGYLSIVDRCNLPHGNSASWRRNRTDGLVNNMPSYYAV